MTMIGARRGRGNDRVGVRRRRGRRRRVDDRPPGERDRWIGLYRDHRCGRGRSRRRRRSVAGDSRGRDQHRHRLEYLYRSRRRRGDRDQQHSGPVAGLAVLRHRHSAISAGLALPRARCIGVELRAVEGPITASSNGSLGGAAGWQRWRIGRKRREHSGRRRWRCINDLWARWARAAMVASRDQCGVDQLWRRRRWCGRTDRRDQCSAVAERRVISCSSMSDDVALASVPDLGHVHARYRCQSRLCDEIAAVVVEREDRRN